MKRFHCALVIHCEHERVFEGANLVRRQRRDREKDGKKGGVGNGISRPLNTTGPLLFLYCLEHFVYLSKPYFCRLKSSKFIKKRLPFKIFKLFDILIGTFLMTLLES